MSLSPAIKTQLESFDHPLSKAILEKLWGHANSSTLFLNEKDKKDFWVSETTYKEVPTVHNTTDTIYTYHYLPHQDSASQQILALLYTEGFRVQSIHKTNFTHQLEISLKRVAVNRFKDDVFSTLLQEGKGLHGPHRTPWDKDALTEFEREYQLFAYIVSEIKKALELAWSQKNVFTIAINWSVAPRTPLKAGIHQLLRKKTFEVTMGQWSVLKSISDYIKYNFGIVDIKLHQIGYGRDRKYELECSNAVR